MAYVDFYCGSLGSNLNAGSISNGAQPGPNAKFSHTNGNWSTVTNNFKVQNGANPSSNISVGDYASVYTDGASVGVYLAKITAVENAVNGNISLSATLAAGLAPTTSGTNRTIQVGGLLKGPNGASGYPLTLSALVTLVASTDKMAINLKNDAPYAITANITETGSPTVLVQGYTTTARDGGKAIIDGGTSGASYNLLTTSAAVGWVHVDLIFQNNGASTALAGVTTSASVVFVRCVFSGMRGSGFSAGSTGATLIECEAFGNNLSNTASLGGFIGAGDYIRCNSHDNTGSNSNGFFASSSSTTVNLLNCISDTNGGVGFNLSETGGQVRLMNCDAYNNGSDGIRTTAAAGLFYVENCNLIKNTGWGINFVTSNKASAFIYNCGFGAGTQVNSSGTTTGTLTGQEVGSITYIANSTPWVDPANGDFRVNLAAAKNAGRGSFTETSASYSGTVGYPDIGSAQHYDTQKSQTFGG